MVQSRVAGLCDRMILIDVHRRCLGVYAKIVDSTEEEEKAIKEMNGKMNIFKIEELIRRTLN